ncbi:uncharacterized protein LOC135925332 [Gordionus sp. m RMFG-2023]|uniref:uncharacterized protein LOC135925332 n=1 Tax=Gordionus sp. m RMFG-2023 TaxID=3053472 RepID=UPI0031FC623B
MMGIPPETQTKLILDGFIKNPDKLFNMNIPKIPQSAYSYFTQKHLKLEFNKSKKLPGKEILKEAAQKWRNLTKEEKLKCVEEWKTLKEEYVKNMENWKSNMQNNGYPEQLINLLSSRRGLYALLKSRKLQDTNKSKDPINDIEKKIENMEIDKISPLHTDKPRKKSKIEK